VSLNVRRVLAGAVLAVTAIGVGAVSARADGPGPVDCTKFPNDPKCLIKASAPPAPGGGGSNGGSGGSVTCHDLTGAVAPCYLPGLGWLGSDGCYYLQTSSAKPPPGALPGSWYTVTCGNAGRNVWLADGQAPGPASLGAEAVKLLALPRPGIRLNPPSPTLQLTHVPTWVWLTEDSWTPRSATASVPGVSVTATATAIRLVLDTGDGKTVPCTGRGTPWTAGTDPIKPSPTCGHPYRPGMFTLTATVTWDVTWVGGGATGTAGPLTTTAAVALQVQESSGLNTGAG
jgi:hypothetical protein